MSEANLFLYRILIFYCMLPCSNTLTAHFVFWRVFFGIESINIEVVWIKLVEDWKNYKSFQVGFVATCWSYLKQVINYKEDILIYWGRYMENNTWMCGLIWNLFRTISRVSKANEWDILFNTRNNFIFPSVRVLFCLLYKKLSYCPSKIEQ